MKKNKLVQSYQTNNPTFRYLRQSSEHVHLRNNICHNHLPDSAIMFDDQA